MAGEIRLTDKERGIVRLRINAAKRAREDGARLRNAVEAEETVFRTEAARNLALLDGSYWSRVNPQALMRTRNHILGPAVVKQAVVCGGKTCFTVTPRDEPWTKLAEKAQPLLTHDWDMLGFDFECDSARWETGSYRYGVVEVGWVYEEADGEETRGSPPDVPATADEELGLGEPTGPEEYLATSPGAPMAEPGGAEVSYSSLPQPRAVRDDPFVERFNPHDFLVDPLCTRPTLTDARYVVRRKREMLERVKANPRYRRTADLKGKDIESLVPGPTDKIEDPGVAADAQAVDLYDCYMFLRRGRKGREKLYHIVMAQDQDEELLCEETPYAHFTHPHSRFPFEVIPGVRTDMEKMGGVADISGVRDTQVSHDEAWTQIEYKRGHSADLLPVPLGTLSGDEGKARKKVLEAGRENAVEEFPLDFSNVKWLGHPPVNIEAQQALEQTPGKIKELLGVSEFQANILPGKQMTKYEAEQLATQGGTRQDYEIEVYHQFLARVAYKVLTLTQEFATEPRTYPTGQAAGGGAYGRLTGFDLREAVPGSRTAGNPLGELEAPGIQFKIEIDASKKRPRNEMLDRQEALQFLQVVAPFAQMPDPRLPTRPLVNLAPALRNLAKKFNLENLDEIVPPDPTPEEIQAAQQQAMHAAQARMAAAQAGGGPMVGPAGQEQQGEGQALQGGAM